MPPNHNTVKKKTKTHRHTKSLFSEILFRLEEGRNAANLHKI